MNDVRHTIEETLAELRQHADELRVKAHLAKMEASDEWKDIEAKLLELETHARKMAVDTVESAAHGTAGAAMALAKDVRDGLEKFAKGL